MSAAETVGLVATSIMAATFAVAAMTKVAAPAVTSKWLADLGLPLSARSLLFAGVTSEAALVGGFVFAPRLACAAALLWLTIATVVLQRSRARRLSCSCFGAGQTTHFAALLRNAGLALLGVVGSLAPAPGGVLGSRMTVVAMLVAGFVTFRVLANTPVEVTA